MAYEIMVLNPRATRGKKRASKKRRKAKHRSSIMAKAKRGKGGRFVKRARKARKHRVRRRKHVAAAPAPRRRRRSGGKRRPAVGYVVGKKRIRRRKLNPRYRRRRHHNPRFSVGGIVGQLKPAAFGAVGGIGLDVLHGYVNPMLPSMFQTGYGKHGAKIVGALGIGWVARKFLRGPGNAIAAGALTLAVYGLLKDVLVQFAPSIPGLGDYEEIVLDNTGDLGAYLPGTGAYLPSGSVSRPGPVGAYMAGQGEDGMMVQGLDI